MVDFESKLLSAVQPSWRNTFIDYRLLKEQVRELLEQTSNRQENLNDEEKNENDLRYQESELSHNFEHILQQQIETVVLYIFQWQGKLAERLETFQKERHGLFDDIEEEVVAITSEESSSTNIDQIHEYQAQVQSLYEKYRELSKEILQFVQYIDWNALAVRKICKKHDKHCLPENRLSRNYTNSDALMVLTANKQSSSGSDEFVGDYNFGISSNASHLHYLYHHGMISALTASLLYAFGDLHEMTVQLHQAKLSLNQLNPNLRDTPIDSGSKKIPAKKSHRRAASSPYVMVRAEDATEVHHVNVDKDDAATFQNQQNHRRRQDQYERRPTLQQGASFIWNHNMKSLFTRGNKKKRRSQQIPFEPILERIQQARRKLYPSTNYQDIVATQALLFEVDSTKDDGDEEEDAAAGITSGATGLGPERQKLSSVLNLMSTFLYMTNYYVVAPSAGMYATKLQASPSLSGIIIGMTPNAALVATVLYGVWSNHSYKPALLFAASCSFAGNICYATALHYNSLSMVLLGRFLNGFGSARSINRRYIADVFSKRERTAASAAFVTSGALGMAVGPAIASVIGKVIQEDPQNFGLWTLETAPGWVMMVLWGIYLAVATLHFEEPDRSHIFSSPKPPSTKKYEASGETKPLLSSSRKNEPMVMESNNKESDASTGELPIYKNVPVVMTLWLYFVLKLVLEVLCSSSSTITTFYFDWNTSQNGAYLAFLGLLMFPANLIVARLSRQYEDRELLLFNSTMLLVSVLGILNYGSGNYDQTRYIMFGVGIFLMTNAMESPNMGLLSKVIPNKWARGTFNSGFLATEAGTLARSVGDVLISASASIVGMEHMIDGIFVPMALLCVVSLVLLIKFYSQMIERDEDDEDD